ncbi:MAG: DNA (cytosine-5-)-methyltransferase [Raoultibacter sp.]
MTSKKIRVAELFAGVGGFRLGLDGYRSKENPSFKMPKAGNFETIWANQWEPPGTTARQFAARCYEERFGKKANLVVEDIALVLDKVQAGEIEIPDCDMVVGGFPCQDYSVAKPLSKAGGIDGKKGVLWWEIYRFLEEKKPRYILLENVDRLLKSPASQRGRDFAIMLSSLNKLGYSVEWRVVNAADYGFVQRRRRVYIYAVLTTDMWDLESRTKSTGVMAEALPIESEVTKNAEFEIPADPYKATKEFGVGDKTSRFLNAGAMQKGVVYTAAVEPVFKGKKMYLGDVIVEESEVPEEFFIPEEKLKSWKYQKGAKSEPRKNKKTGFEYHYSEGSMAFPDPLDRPSRTILTGEGGSGASRFKHVIQTESGRYRRLVPDELDQLQGFPKGWTDTGMTNGHRAFCMGNALVVGIPHNIGKAIWRRFSKGLAD